MTPNEEIDWQERALKAESELEELKKYLVPIAKRFSGEYNKWRIKNSKVPGWVEAGEYITKYIRERTQGRTSTDK